MKSELTCLILAGGLGTRLRAVLHDIPKPMAPVNGRPFLEYLLAQVRMAGLTDVILCVGHQAQVIENYFGDGREHAVQIRYSREPELLGTAGALSQARSLIRSEPFVVMNGDSYCSIDFDELIKQHKARRAVATVAATLVENQSRYGSMLLGPQDVIARFFEKSEGGSGYVNGGIYMLSHEVLGLIPPGQKLSMEQDVFPSLVGRGLYAFKTRGVFIDIGLPRELERAQTILKNLDGFPS